MSFLQNLNLIILINQWGRALDLSSLGYLSPCLLPTGQMVSDQIDINKPVRSYYSFFFLFIRSLFSVFLVFLDSKTSPEKVEK
jgi:hypothetical protein